jgi:hypothetical protein
MSTIHIAAPLRRLPAALACLLVLALAASSAARAADEFGIDPGTFTARVEDATGALEQRAGAIPYSATTAFRLRYTGFYPFSAKPNENLKDVVVELPAGFIGNPEALPKCSAEQFATDSGEGTMQPACPAETQVGMAWNTLDLGAVTFDGMDSKVYNLVPPPGKPAAFGFNAMGVPVKLVADVRDGDHGLTLRISNVSPASPLIDTRVTFWGVPADPRHDGERGGPSTAPLKPFLSNPVDCQSGPLRTTVRVRSWQRQDRWVTDTADTPSAPHDCDRLDFRPQIEVTPDTTRAGVPAGYTVRLHLPQSDAVDGPVTPHLRDAVVTLPEGTSVSPSSADGLRACTPGQVDLATSSKPTCPEASKIGTVEIDTPLMGEPMRGGIYLAEPTDDQLLAVYLVASGQGVTLKLPGSIDPDPRTGRLTTTFLDNPQLPFTDLTLRFKGGARAPLVNPSTCGPATTEGSFAAWSDGPAGTSGATASDTFQVDTDANGAPCPATVPFAPRLSAGLASAKAGAFSPFTLRIARSDADQELGSLSRVSMPPGLVADVGSVPLCDAADAAAGTCGEASRVGTVTTGSGAGDNPLQIPGQVFMTTGYKGAPYGLSIVVPAKAGPFDLGLVVVRAAVRVNNDASLTVDADPLPTILKGIPLKLRSIALNFDRPRFMLAPTSCAPMAIGATVDSTTGAKASVESRFQVGNCAALPFEPKLTATVAADRTDGASLHVRLTQTPGQANARSVTVALPEAIAARMTTLQAACTEEQAATGTCPERTKLGEATAVTPILSQPLSGPVYLVRNGGRVPALKVELRGEVAIDLIGTNVITDRLTITSTFGTIPDVPLSSFDLRLRGGSDSILRRIGSICTQDLSTPTTMVGQNGKRVVTSTVIAPQGCKLGAKAKATAKRTGVTVTVNLPEPGRVKLAGATVKGATKTLARSGAVTATLPLTAKARKTLASRGKVAVTVKATFTPRSGAAPATATAKVTVKAPKAKQKR